MKKLLFSLSLLLLPRISASACADGDYEDSYFNLFAQEIIDDYHYYPFLLNYGAWFKDTYDWRTGKDIAKLPNQNLEEWESYFEQKLTYAEVEKLLLNSTLDDFTKKTKLQKLIKKIPEGKQQAFIDYMKITKTIEPYATNNKWFDYSWDGDKDVKTPVNDETLDYNQLINQLKESYNGTKNAFYKMRYGYQMVRLAHYYQKYDESVQFFDDYVEKAELKNAVYYYALEQKGGALKSLGKNGEAIVCFVQTFLNCKDKKESAYCSYKFTDSKAFESAKKLCKTNEEKATLYFFLGYQEFSNPIESLQNIEKLDPNSEIMQVLSVRAINELERTILDTDGGCGYYWNDDDENPDTYNVCKNAGKNMVPDYDPTKNGYLKDLKAVFAKTSQVATGQKKTFYQLANAYTSFLEKDYTEANHLLDQIQTSEKKYVSQKESLRMLVEIASQDKITPAFEQAFYQKYKNTLEQRDLNDFFNYYRYSDNNDLQFVLDVLANRYYNQGDLAKAFLCHNSFKSLESNQDLKMIDGLEKFFQKSTMNPMETYLAKAFGLIKGTPFDKLNDFRGTYYLKQGDLQQSLAYFSKISKDYQCKDYYTDWGKNGKTSLKISKYDGFTNIPNTIFKLNIREWFSGKTQDVMTEGDISDFKFITKKFNKKQAVEYLIQLEKIAQGNDELAGKANLLLGNFFYNITDYGYYRNVFHYEIGNGHCFKFNIKPDYYGAYESDKKQPFYYYKHGLPTETLTSTSTSLAYYEKAFNLLQNPELKALSAFGGAKAEQGNFYNTYDFSERKNEDYEQQDKRIEADQMRDYKKFFARLKQLSNTKIYGKARSKCQYFEYYVNR